LVGLPYGIEIVAHRSNTIDIDTTATASIRTQTGVNGRFISMVGRTSGESGFNILGLQGGDVIELVMLQPDNHAAPAVGNVWTEPNAGTTAVHGVQDLISDGWAKTEQG
jgi:hypothetical protein